MTKAASAEPERDMDSELSAVRRLMVESAAIARETSDEDIPLTPGPVPGYARRVPLVAPAGDAQSPASTSRSRGILKNLFATAVVRAKAYRPDRKSIFVTSLVLLALLHPGMVFGTAFLTVLLIGACYYCQGHDVFWRRVLALFVAWEKQDPVGARQVKLRAYVFAKRWDRRTGRLPGGLADKLALPDLKRLMSADAAHDAALSERLNRLHQDARG